MVIFFIFPSKWCSYIILFWSLPKLLLIIYEFRKITKKQVLQFLIIAAPFWVILTIPSFYEGTYGKFIERLNSFWIFPFILLLKKEEYYIEHFKKIIQIYIIGVFVLCVKGFLMVTFLPNQYEYFEFQNWFHIFRNEFNVRTEIHPTYASLYILLANIFIVYIPQRGMLFKLNVLFLIINILFLYLLSAKIAIFTFGILSAIYLIRQFIYTKKKIFISIFALGVIAFILLLFTNDRIKELITVHKSTDEIENSVVIRSQILQCTFETISDHWITGLGPQNTQLELDRCYYHFESNAFENNSFNSHNQFLDYWLNYGILGFVCFIFYMIYLYKCIGNNSFVGLMFLIASTFILLTENILTRQAGVVFFCFWTSYFLCINSSNGRSDTANDYKK